MGWNGLALKVPLKAGSHLVLCTDPEQAEGLESRNGLEV